jgi:hypothetical protein
MRSIGLISKKFFVLVGYFLDIPLMARVKTPILRDTLKKYPIRKVFFQRSKSFIQGQKQKEV